MKCGAKSELPIRSGVLAWSHHRLTGVPCWVRLAESIAYRRAYGSPSPWIFGGRSSPRGANQVAEIGQCLPREALDLYTLGGGLVVRSLDRCDDRICLCYFSFFGKYEVTNMKVICCDVGNGLKMWVPSPCAETLCKTNGILNIL